MKTRRAKHLLVGKILADSLERSGKLPTSKSVATAANVHPATARRWLADFRAIHPMKASALTRWSSP